MNIPYDRVDDLAPKLIGPKDMQVLVYCADSACEASQIAARRLIELGYRNVSEYEAGKEEWVSLGYPTAKGSAPFGGNGSCCSTKSA